LHVIPESDSQRVEDRITGKVGEVRFDMAEAFLSRGRRKSRQQIYHGLLIRLPSPRDVTGPILVRADAGLFQGWLSSKPNPGTAVYFNDAAFEDRFEVRALDPEEAERLLDPALRSVLITLGQGIARQVTGAFYDNELFLSLSRGKDSFEPGSLFQPLPNPARVRAVADDIDIIHEIIDRLDLERIYPSPPAR
jgi:hypothetical protein